MAANVRFLQGTSEAFQNLNKDFQTFYLVDGKDLYLGNRKLSNEDEIKAAVKDIENNAEDIKALQDEIKALLGEEGATGSLEQLLVQLSNDLKAHVAEELGKEVLRATGAEAALEGQITALTETVSSNKTDIEGKLATTNENVQTNADAIEQHGKDITALQESLGTNVEELRDDIEAVDARVTELLGPDMPKEEGQTAPTIREIAEAAASAKVDAVVDNAPENFDTLKEIANWITNDETGAASIAATVAKQGKAISDLQAVDTTLTESISKNTGDIETINGTLTTHAGSISALEAKDSEIEQTITNNYNALDKAITDHADENTQAFNDIQGKLDALEATDEEHAGQIEANTTDIETVSGRVDTVDGQITSINDSISSINTTLGKLGTASEKSVEFFTTKIDDAETRAKAHAESLLSWKDFPTA